MKKAVNYYIHPYQHTANVCSNTPHRNSQPSAAVAITLGWLTEYVLILMNRTVLYWASLYYMHPVELVFSAAAAALMIVHHRAANYRRAALLGLGVGCGDW